MSSNQYVYGSPCRPISRTWASIPGAEYVPVDKAETGMYTHVVVSERLSREVVDKYELVLVSRPPRPERGVNHA